jgi:hypothetical protein
MGIANSLNLSEKLKLCQTINDLRFFYVSKVWFGFGQWSGRASVMVAVLANAAPHLCRSLLKSAAPWCDTTNAASFAKHAMIIIYHHDQGQPVSGRIPFVTCGRCPKMQKYLPVLIHL